PAARQRLQDNLQMLRPSGTTGDGGLTAPRMSAAEEAAVRRFTSEVSRELSAIQRQLRESPKEGWASLEQLRAKVADAEIPDEARRQLLVRVDRELEAAEAFIERNRPRIELDAQNR